MTRFKFVCAVVLSLPFLVVFLLFDIVKAPVAALVFLPIGLLLGGVMTLRGEEFFRLSAIPFLFFMGTLFWWECLLGQDAPKWCDPFK